MELGTFSVSLAVKDLHASQAFYESFGFQLFAGDPTRNWAILKNGTTVIGLFQGMFKTNILTFNPGWDSNGSPLASFTDIRELQRQLKAKGGSSRPGGGREHHGSRQLHGCGPRWQPHPGRPARLTGDRSRTVTLSFGGSPLPVVALLTRCVRQRPAPRERPRRAPRPIPGMSGRGCP